MKVEEKSPAAKRTRPSLRVQETTTEIRHTMPNTRVAKPGNPHTGPHIISPDDGEEALESIPSASNVGGQQGPNIIPLEDPLYRYQTRRCTHQMNHVATLKDYSSEELMNTLR
eukprot:13458704-Ditylum_brightwellii.AAC.1